MDRAKKIFELLKQRGWSKTQLAERAGLRPRNVSYVITGSREPGVSSAIAIARTLGVSAEWLFDDEQNWPPSTKPSAATLSDMELVEELASRRDLLIRDTLKVYDGLPPDRLQRLDDLAGRDELSPDEEAELSRGKRDLLHALSLNNRELWLEPNNIYPPKYCPEPVSVLLHNYPRLIEAFEHVWDQVDVVDPRVSGAPGLPPDDRSIPRHPGIPRLVLGDDVAVVSDAKRSGFREFVPVLFSIKDAPPQPNAEGLYNPLIVSFYVSYRTADPLAFAIWVSDDYQRYLIILEPNRRPAPDDDCLVVTPGDPPSSEIRKAGSLAEAGADGSTVDRERNSQLLVFPIAHCFPHEPEEG